MLAAAKAAVAVPPLAPFLATSGESPAMLIRVGGSSVPLPAQLLKRPFLELVEAFAVRLLSVAAAGLDWGPYVMAVALAC